MRYRLYRHLEAEHWTRESAAGNAVRDGVGEQLPLGRSKESVRAFEAEVIDASAHRHVRKSVGARTDACYNATIHNLSTSIRSNASNINYHKELPRLRLLMRYINERDIIRGTSPRTGSEEPARITNAECIQRDNQHRAVQDICTAY